MFTAELHEFSPPLLLHPFFLQALLDIKEMDLKKLGVYNSKDRAAMLGSLANYRAVREESGLCEYLHVCILSLDHSGSPCVGERETMVEYLTDKTVAAVGLES